MGSSWSWVPLGNRIKDTLGRESIGEETGKET